MSEKNLNSFSLLMLLGVVLGALCGFFLPGVSNGLDFLGRLFLGALKILVIPLVFAAIITGLNTFGEARKAGRTGLRVAGYFAATTAVAVVVGLIASLMLSPSTLNLTGRALDVSPTGWENLSDAIGSLLPGNLVQAAVEGKYLGFVLLALLLGGVLLSMKARARSVISFVKGIHEALLKLVGLLYYAAPIGLFSLVGSAVAQNRGALSDWSQMPATYLLVVVIALLVHWLIILPLAVWLFGHRSPFAFYGQLWPAFLTAFGTGSSIAAYPVTYSCLNDETGVDNRATSSVLPLGSVVNLNGTAISIVVAGVFAMKLAGVPLAIDKVLLLAVMGFILSIGAAGIPTVALLVSPVLFSALGLTPGQAITAGTVLVLTDWLVDRLRAVVNMSGDAVGSAVIAESFELKTARGGVRERRPARSARPVPGRERRSPRSEGRRDSRRSDRDDDKQRSRRGKAPARPESDGGGQRQGGTGRGARNERSPFQMKASSTPSLENEPGKPVSGRPARPQGRAASDDAPAPRGGRERRQGDRRSEERTAQPGQRPDRRSSQRAPREGSENRREGRSRRRPDTRTRDRSEVVAAEEKPESRPAAVEVAPVEEPKDRPGNAEYGRLSPSVVARELARVSAQLREGDDDQPEHEPEPEAVEKPAPVAEAPTPVRAEPEAAPPVADETESFEEEEEPSPVANDDVEPDEPQEEEAEAEAGPEVSFGRSRNYRGSALKKKEVEAPPETPESPEESQDGFSSENAAFGRVKRKRVR